jgi:hypothetical protein
MTPASHIAVVAGLLALSACVVASPNGPTIAVMPGQGKSFEAFQQDDFVCHQFANQSIGFASPGQAAAQTRQTKAPSRRDSETAGASIG